MRLLLIGDLVLTAVAIFCIFLLTLGVDFEYSALSFALNYAMLISHTFYSFVSDVCYSEKEFISVERIRQYQLHNTLEDLEARPEHFNTQLQPIP